MQTLPLLKEPDEITLYSFLTSGPVASRGSLGSSWMFFIRSQKDFKPISFDLFSNHFARILSSFLFFLVLTASREVPTSLYYSLTKWVSFVFLKIRKQRFRLFCFVFVCLFYLFGSTFEPQFIKFILEKERNTTKQTEKVVCFRELQGINFKKCQHNFFHDVTLLSSCRFAHTSWWF